MNPLGEGGSSIMVLYIRQLRSAGARLDTIDLVLVSIRKSTRSPLISPAFLDVFSELTVASLFPNRTRMFALAYVLSAQRRVSGSRRLVPHLRWVLRFVREQVTPVRLPGIVEWLLPL